MFEAFRGTFPGADEQVASRRGVVEAIFDAAAEVDASVAAVRSRDVSRLVQPLSGDRTRKLVTDPDLPVVSLPVPPDAVE